MRSHPAFARVAPFAVFILFVATAPLLGGAVDDRWWTIARGLVCGAVLIAFWPGYTELKTGDGPGYFEWLLAVVVGVVAFGIWITFDFDWARFGRDHPFVPLRPDGSIDAVMVTLRIVGLALVVPVMEELFWRSFFMRWIDKRDFLAADPRAATPLAVFLSSLLFASEHTQWFAGLTAGILYAWLYKRTGDLRIPILSHATTNAILAFWVLSTGRWNYW